jgi:hypothetical protein
LSPRPLLLITSALWRAQAVHLLLFVVLPVAAAAARAVWGVALLPLLLVGPGDRAESLADGVAHLAEPGCWVVLAPCSVADLALVSPRGGGGEAVAGAALPGAGGVGVAAVAVEGEPFLPWPTALTLRHAWLGLWLLWFLVFLVQRERRQRLQQAARRGPGGGHR